MKKVAVLLLICVILLCACTQKDVIMEEDTDKDNIQVTVKAQGTGPNYILYDFYTYDELEQFPLFEMLERDMEQEEYLLWNEQFHWDKIPIPYRGSQPVPLESTIDESLILFFSSELYARPWFWFRTVVSGQPITIRMLMDPNALQGVAPGASGSEVVRHIWPSAPNIENAHEREDYSLITEMDIQTADGTKTALLTKSAIYDSESLFFVQNGYFVLINAPQGIITNSWLNTFNIQQISIA